MSTRAKWAKASQRLKKNKRENPTSACYSVYSSSRVIYSQASPSWTYSCALGKIPQRREREKTKVDAGDTTPLREPNWTRPVRLWPERVRSSAPSDLSTHPPAHRRLTYPPAHKERFPFFLKTRECSKACRRVARQLRILLRFFIFFLHFLT